MLFFALFGYCHTFEDMRADSYRKYGSFMHYGTVRGVEDIVDDFRDGEIKDLYEDVLFASLRDLTDDPHIMMMAVGLFGGFFSKSSAILPFKRYPFVLIEITSPSFLSSV